MFDKIKNVKFAKKVNKAVTNYVAAIRKYCPNADLVASERADGTGSGRTWINPETNSIIAWVDADHDTGIMEYYFLATLIFTVDLAKKQIKFES